MAIVIENPHIETVGAFSHDFADASHTNQAKCGVVDFRATEEKRSPTSISAGAQEAFRLRNAAGRGHEQTKGKVGSCVSEYTGRVAHRDTQASSGSEVDIIEANGHICEHA